MRVYKTQKHILSLRKPGIKQFLNGLTSNDMDAPRNAFLNIHGRIIAVFDLLKVSDEEYWILLEKPFVEPLLQHLDRYVKLGSVAVQRLDKNVYFDLDGSVEPQAGEHTIAQKKGRLLITDRALGTSVSEEEFTAFRLDHNIPVHGIDYQDEMLLNVSTTEHVSFKKGCFLGQEPVSKVFNRSKPTWRLVAKAYDACDDEEKNKMTSQVVHPVLKKKMGFVFEKND